MNDRAKQCKPWRVKQPRPEYAHRVERALEWIIEYKEQHDGNSPTTRAIMCGLGLTSTCIVHRILRRLAEQGRITLLGKEDGGIGIAVVGGVWLYCGDGRGRR